MDTSINARNIGTQTPFTLPPTKPVDATLSQVPQTLYQQNTANLQGLTTQGDALQKQLEQLGNARMSFGQQLEGQTVDLQAEEQKLGVQTELQNVREAQTALNSANQKLLALQRQSMIAPEITQQESIGRGRTAAGVAPLDMAKQRELAIQAIPIAIEADIAQYKLTGSQANLENARSEAKRLVDLKYQPIKERIELLKTAYDMNKDLLERVDKKRADAMSIALKKEERDYQYKLDQDKKIQDMIISASPYAPSSLISKAKEIQANGGSGVEVAIALGKYGGDYLGDLVKRSTIAKNDAEYQKTMKEIKALGQVPQITAPVGTNANFVQTLATSAVNKESLGQTERTAITKNLTVLDQLDSLEKNISKQNNTGFIKGKVNNLLAAVGQNADVGTINAQLQAIVPNLARGVYGEVGVLTDNDIANYRKTLPTLTMPEEQNKAILALTLKSVQKNLKNTLETAANSKLDVSRFATQYQQVTNKINDIEDRIGVSDLRVKEYADLNPSLKPMIEKLIIEGRTGSEILQIIGVEN